MLKIALLTCLCLLTTVTYAATDETERAVKSRLQAWHALKGTFAFEQEKTLPGFSRPLRSAGEVIIEDDALHWNTQKPVASSMQIDAAGVHQLHDGEPARIEGSGFVGKLLLAMVQQDYAFISDHFTTALDANCIQLTPREASMRDYYQQIALCGEAQLQRIEMHEADGSETHIRLQEVIDA